MRRRSPRQPKEAKLPEFMSDDRETDLHRLSVSQLREARDVARRRGDDHAVRIFLDELSRRRVSAARQPDRHDDEDFGLED